jgi:hypothetical protein
LGIGAVKVSRQDPRDDIVAPVVGLLQLDAALAADAPPREARVAQGLPTAGYRLFRNVR